MTNRLKTLHDNDGNTIYPNTVSASVLSNDGNTPLSESLGSNNIESIGSGTITSAIVAISKYSTYPPYVSEGKEKIAEAITQKGVTTYGTDEFEVMANNIMNINRIGIPYQEKSVTLDTKNSSVEIIPDIGYDWLTKVKANINLQNKTVSINHGLLTVEPDDGKVLNTVLINGPTDRGSWSSSLDTATTEVTIPEGYHNGSGKVEISTQSKTASLDTNTTSVTVKPDSGKVLNQVTASITTQSKTQNINYGSTTVYPDSDKVLNCVIINGPINQGSWSSNTIDSGDITIPEGYHNGTGYVSGQGAYDSGYSAGNSDGYTKGYNDGNTNGYNSGYNAGNSDGYTRGQSIQIALNSWNRVVNSTSRSDVKFGAIICRVGDTFNFDNFWNRPSNEGVKNGVNWDNQWVGGLSGPTDGFGLNIYGENLGGSWNIAQWGGSLGVNQVRAVNNGVAVINAAYKEVSGGSSILHCMFILVLPLDFRTTTDKGVIDSGLKESHTSMTASDCSISSGSSGTSISPGQQVKIPANRFFTSDTYFHASIPSSSGTFTTEKFSGSVSTTGNNDYKSKSWTYSGEGKIVGIKSWGSSNCDGNIASISFTDTTVKATFRSVDSEAETANLSVTVVIYK